MTEQTPAAATIADALKAGAKPAYGTEIRALHRSLIAKLDALHVLRLPRIQSDMDPEDWTELGRYKHAALELIKEWDAELCAIAGMRGAGNLDDLIGGGDAALSDMQSDFAGVMRRVADKITDDRYDGCPRGVMHRVRP